MLSVHVYDSPDRGVMLADLSVPAKPENGGRGFRFGTNKHGFSLFDYPFLEQKLIDAFIDYDWPGVPHVEVSDEFGSVAWAGRLEDIALVPGGVQLGGLGYWRAFRDVPYTALWSDTRYDSWRVGNEQDNTQLKPAKFNQDQDGRLYISLKKGETYDDSADWGGFVFERPDNSNRSDQMIISFDYSVTLPTDMIFRIRSYDAGFTGTTFELDVVTGDGTNQTGSVSETISANKEIIEISVFNDSGSGITPSEESQEWFAKVTNIRVKTTSNSSVLAHNIAKSLIGFVAGINSSQLSSIGDLVQATSEDMLQAVYEDLYPADILDLLALRNGCDAAVWEDRILSFAPVGTDALNWFVDVTEITMQRSLEHVINSTYSVYRDESGFTRRTTPASDQASIDRFGIVRRLALPVSTSDGTEAKAYSDQFLTDRKDFQIRADVKFERLELEGGGSYPLHALRAGDTLTLRNIEAGAPDDVDNIRTFRVGETEFSSDGRMAVAPREGVPTLINLVSQAQGRAQDDWTGDIFDPRKF